MKKSRSAILLESTGQSGFEGDIFRVIFSLQLLRAIIFSNSRRLSIYN